VALGTPARGRQSEAAGNGPGACDAWRQGRVPLHLRMGVTGHRSIDEDDPAVAGAVRDALDQIEERRRNAAAATPVDLTVVSALAEGADRLVARQAMLRGASLEVVLPLPSGDYLADFTSAASRAEFRALLGQAAAVTELATVSRREEAYERAGRAVVDRSDVVVALWDGRASGGRGGTAEIVAYARQRHVPVLRIAAGRPGQGSPRPSPIDDLSLPGALGPLGDDAFAGLDRFNSSSLRKADRGDQHVLLPSELAAAAPPHVQRFVDYAQPYFHRAEWIARSSQRLFLRLTRMLYLLAAAAVVVVATQIIFFGRDHWIVWAEVVALVAVVVTLMLGRRARWHDRWLASRYLAERIRSGVFLAATGAGDGLRPVAGGGRQADSAELDPNREWAERAFREIYWRASRSPVPEPEVPALRKLLIDAWIDDQIGYHKKTMCRLAKRQRQLTWLAVALFGVSAVVALLHSMHLLVGRSEPDVWGYLSVVIPAIGAALSGYGAQREYARLAERSRLMVARLRDAREMVGDAKRLSSLQRATRSTELLMRSETADWYDVVRLHDFEVPA
jgi:SMODS and SLOG-associating 2TM effector domain 3